jgi:hypothetical protein
MSRNGMKVTFVLPCLNDGRTVAAGDAEAQGCRGSRRCTEVVGVTLALAFVISALAMQILVRQPPPPEEFGEPRS